MIDKQTIDKILDMSRIDVKEQTKDKFTAQVQNIINYVEKITDLDTSSAEDRESVFEEKNIFDADQIGVSLTQPELRKYTKNYLDGYYAVPKIINKE